MLFCSFRDLIRLCAKENLAIWQLALRSESLDTDVPEEQIRERMREALTVMKEAAAAGIRNPDSSASGLSGGDAYRFSEAQNRPDIRFYSGNLSRKAIGYALAVSERNASMGRIVAAPTAGSCGILPGVLMAAAEERGFSDDLLLEGMFTAAAVGLILAERATLAGAEGGCQAECGSAAAMAAAALCHMGGGTAEDVASAVALTMKSLMGLVCDPVGGLVEVPCVKRNATGATLAITAADMALAGIRTKIPVDEVIDAMGAVGRTMPESLRETGEGGVAATPTGKAYAEAIFGGERI